MRLISLFFANKILNPLSKLEIDISVEAGDWPAHLAEKAEPIVALALAQAGVLVSGPAELSVLLTDDAHQRALNDQWRNIDKSTNVLSFPQIEPFTPLSGLVGDISLAYETLVREAGEQDVSFDDHFTHLLVHGFLHLLGHDHLQEDEAQKMEQLETQILGAMGIADPYAEA